MRRSVLLFMATAVLGAGCTEDRPAEGAGDPTKPGGAKPRCAASLGQPPEGFVLVRTREFRYPDRIGVREEYRHPNGRLLVNLLGVGGQVGEHATIADEVELVTGEPATIFGDGKNPNWALVWSGRPPCRQLAVVGNGFTRGEFELAMSEAGLLASDG